MYDIKEKLDNLFHLIFKVPKKKIKKNLSFKNVKKWDSLNHVNLILAIESKFKIKIEPEESINLLSYKDIYSYLEKKISTANKVK
tara:strand:- start:4284 stop:4538 length:255 start_codon:yes stop_codon:yes gene_type:complete